MFELQRAACKPPSTTSGKRAQGAERFKVGTSATNRQRDPTGCRVRSQTRARTHGATSGAASPFARRNVDRRCLAGPKQEEQFVLGSERGVWGGAAASHGMRFASLSWFTTVQGTFTSSSSGDGWGTVAGVHRSRSPLPAQRPQRHTEGPLAPHTRPRVRHAYHIRARTRASSRASTLRTHSSTPRRARPRTLPSAARSLLLSDGHKAPPACQLGEQNSAWSQGRLAARRLVRAESECLATPAAQRDRLLAASFAL